MKNFIPFILIMAILLLLSTCSNEPLSPLSEAMKNAIDNNENQETDGTDNNGQEDIILDSTTGILYGTVSEADGYGYLKNLSMVTVAVPGTGLYDITDNNGDYRIEDVPLGEYKIKFDATACTNRASRISPSPYGIITNNINYSQKITIQTGENYLIHMYFVYNSLAGPFCIIVPYQP